MQSSKKISKLKSTSRSSSLRSSPKEKTSESSKPGMDPKPPKPPLSPFHRYRNEVFPEYRKMMPDRSVAAITETIADQWVKMTKEERLRFNMQFLDELQDYIEERDEFERKNGPVRHIKFTLDDGDNPLEGIYFNSVAGEGQLIKLIPENRMKEKGPRRKASYSQREESDKESRQSKFKQIKIRSQSKEDFKKDSDVKAKSERPDPPKKPQTPFFLFKNDNFAKLKGKNPEANAVEISVMLAKEWRKVSRNTKRKYENQYDRDFRNYQKELVLYEERYGKIQRRRKNKRENSVSGKRPKLSQYEMKVKDRKGVRPQIIPGEEMIGNKPRDESRRRSRSLKQINLLDYFSDDPSYSTIKKQKATKSPNEDKSTNKKKVIIPKRKNLS